MMKMNTSRRNEDSRRRTRNLFRSVISNTLKVPEKLTVSQWAEKRRVLDDSSNFGGRWSNDITPYLVGVMDAFNDPGITEINFVKPTQVGGTEAMLNAIGWIITQCPAPTMMVYDTDDLARDTSNDRLRPSLTLTPEIKDRFYENESKELNLKFRGMHMYFRGSKTPGKLASKAIRFLFFDEIDKMGGATKKEASPYNLAKERTRTFPYTKKIFTASTPTLRSNYVWSIHEAADEQREYFMPCPHCGKWIQFKWSRVSFPGEDENGEKLDIETRATAAVYACQECGCVITDRDKIGMLRSGEWRAVKKRENGPCRRVSFHLNALYSRFLTWYDIVKEFLESKDDPSKLQNFVNSWLAEPWEDTKLKTNADLVFERQTDLEEFVLPEWTKLLTGGVDVQENCLYWTIRAWGDYLTSQNIAHGQAFSFAEVTKIMNFEFKKLNGDSAIVNLALVDSGDQTDDVYEYCAINAEWAMPCKGISNGLSHYRLSKVNKTDSRAYGMNLVLVDGNKYKDMIASRMRKENGKGSWMVYRGCEQDYADQVTAEHKIVDRSGGREKQTWKLKTSHAANHYLDCEVYAMAAADVLGVRNLFLQNQVDEVPNPKPEPQKQYTPEESWINQNENWI